MTDYAAGNPWKQARQLHIMQSAYQLFSRRGIAPVTMPDIAGATR